MRTEVEELVGAPAAQDLHPAGIANGKVSYWTTYETDFGSPPTVRPILITRPQRVGHNSNPKSLTLVTLEYDATEYGHPLLRVYYPDPLF
jgi:hypothetical protein